MRVLSWSKKLSLSSERHKKAARDSLKSVSKKSPLRKSVSSLSRFLSSSSLPLSLRRSRAREIPDHCSPVLLPLTIRLDTASLRPRHRASTLGHRSEMRSLLQQRFTQRILERSGANVILEARQEIESERNDPEIEDVYVTCDFHLQTPKRRTRGRQTLTSEEDPYMTMNEINQASLHSVTFYSY